MSARPLLFFAALELAACGTSDDAIGPLPHYRIPGCEAYDTAPCDVRDFTCQSHLMQLAVCLREDQPAELPPVSVVSESQYTEIVRERAAERQPPAHVHEYETALAMFGLVRPGALESEAMVQFTATHIDGEYRPDTQDVLIVDHGTKTDIAESSDTLVHEFVHALQFRELPTFGDGYVGTFDTHLALKSLIEGEARFHELRYRAPMVGLDPHRIDWQRTFQSNVDREETWVIEQESPFIAVASALPYGWGARVFSFDWNETGHAGVLARFAEPPTTTHALMASVDAFVPDGFAPLDIPLPEPPPEWSVVTDDVFGAVGTFLVLARDLVPDEARPLALDWRGDKFTVLQSSTDPSAVVNAALWSVEFASESSAKAAASHMKPAIQATTRVTGTRLTVAVSDRTADLSWALPPE